MKLQHNPTAHKYEPVWHVLRAFIPGSDLVAIDYSTCIAKHILHMTIAMTVFVAMTLHQSVLLQALMVVSYCFLPSLRLQVQAPAIAQQTSANFIDEIAAKQRTLVFPYRDGSAEQWIRSVSCGT